MPNSEDLTMRYQSESPELARTIIGMVPTLRAWALLLLVMVWPSPVDGQSSVCRASTATATRMITFVQKLASANDADHQILRDSLNLPYSSNPSITLIANESTCKKVRDAMNTAYQTPGQTRQIWVVRTTDGYAALDPLEPSGEWRYLLFVSKKYAYKGIVLF